MLFIISQIFSLIYMIISIFSYLTKKRISLMILQTLANVSLTLSYVFIFKLFGVLGSAIASIRALIFSLFAYKGKEVPWWLVIVIILGNVISVIFSFTYWYDAIYCLGLTLFTLSFKIKNLLKMKIALMIAIIFYIVFTFFAQNYVSCISTVFEFVSVNVGIFMLVRAKKRSPEKEVIENYDKSQE